MKPNRRHFVLASAALAAPTWAAFSADGPARLRPGAAQGSFLDLALAGTRLVAVGERGHVLLSDDAGTTWRQAKSVPTRITLTCVHATDARTLWAAGHGGVILKSADAGDTWTVATGKADGADVLLSIRVDADGRGLAVGGFGFAQATADGGTSWKTITLLEGEAGEKHFNRIFVSGAGSWLIAAEGGQVLRSADRGAVADMKWAAVATPYKGSLWCGLAAPGGWLLAGGMRGNVVRSGDDGLSWTHQAVAGAGSFTGATVLADGRVALVGVDGTLVLGDSRGENFRLRRLDDRANLTAVQPQAGGALVLATQAGLRSVPVAAN